MDNEDPISHLIKSYKIVESSEALDNEEENLYLRLFPHSLIGQAKYWYLDQPSSNDYFLKVMLNQNGFKTILYSFDDNNM